eukprot:scaffold4937_cov261-Pinguiococcus_pyrenoidosus.AAC.2
MVRRFLPGPTFRTFPNFESADRISFGSETLHKLRIGLGIPDQEPRAPLWPPTSLKHAGVLYPSQRARDFAGTDLQANSAISPLAGSVFLAHLVVGVGDLIRHLLARPQLEASGVEGQRLLVGASWRRAEQHLGHIPLDEADARNLEAPFAQGLLHAGVFGKLLLRLLQGLLDAERVRHLLLRRCVLAQAAQQDANPLVPITKRLLVFSRFRYSLLRQLQALSDELLPHSRIVQFLEVRKIDKKGTSKLGKAPHRVAAVAERSRQTLACRGFQPAKHFVERQPIVSPAADTIHKIIGSSSTVAKQNAATAWQTTEFQAPATKARKAAPHLREIMMRPGPPPQNLRLQLCSAVQQIEELLGAALLVEPIRISDHLGSRLSHRESASAAQRRLPQALAQRSQQPKDYRQAELGAHRRSLTGKAALNS